MTWLIVLAALAVMAGVSVLARLTQHHTGQRAAPRAAGRHTPAADEQPPAPIPS